MKILAVILAGGEGRRIGGDKPARLLAGRPLLDHVAARAADWGLPCRVAVRTAGQGAAAPDLPFLIDEGGGGPIAGVAAALHQARRDGCQAALTLPCDTPFLPDDLPDRLVAAAADGRLAAVARSLGRLHPTCALWRVEAEDLLAPYRAEAASLKGFAERLQAAIVDWPADPDPFFNVNSEKDLEEAERILRNR